MILALAARQRAVQVMRCDARATLFTRLDVVARDEVQQLTQSFVILNEVLEDLALLDLFEARAGRLRRLWLSRLRVDGLSGLPFV